MEGFPHPCPLGVRLSHGAESKFRIGLHNEIKEGTFSVSSLFRDKPKEKMGFCCLIFVSENNSVTFLMTCST